MFTSLSFRRFVELPAVDDRSGTTPLLIAANSPQLLNPSNSTGLANAAYHDCKQTESNLRL